jgi:hypothetical protein
MWHHQKYGINLELGNRQNLLEDEAKQKTVSSRPVTGPSGYILSIREQYNRENV